MKWNGRELSPWMHGRPFHSGMYMRLCKETDWFAWWTGDRWLEGSDTIGEAYAKTATSEIQRGVPYRGLASPYSDEPERRQHDHGCRCAVAR